MKLHLTDAQLRELIAIAAGDYPVNMHQEKIRIRLKHMGLAWRDEYYPWKWHLTDDGIRCQK